MITRFVYFVVFSCSKETENAIEGWGDRNVTDTQKIGSGASLVDTKQFNAFGDVTQHALASVNVINPTYTAIHQPSTIVSDIGNGNETIARYEYNYESAGTDKRPLVKKKILASGTGIYTDFSYDSESRMISNNSKNASNTTLVGFEHTYDLAGNRKTDKHLLRLQDSENYVYDTALRFNDYKRGTIGGTPNFTQGYTLDALANWTTFNNNGTLENRTHSATNEITSINALPLTHDTEGNLTTNKNGDQYFRDKLNRLVEVRNLSNTQIALYFYNVDNLRVQKTNAVGTEQYYYSGSRVAVETDGNQSITKEYIQCGQYIDEVITVTTGGLTYFYLYDIRFNVYGLIDTNGNIVERIRYQGYGKAEFLDASFSLASPIVNQPYTYTGQRLDLETGLQYFRLRCFDIDLDRFISRDPIGYIDGMNLYRGYFINGVVDPLGMQEIKSPEEKLPARTVNHFLYSAKELFRLPTAPPADSTKKLMSSIVPASPCKKGDLKIEVYKIEWAFERSVSLRFINNQTTTEGILSQQAQETLKKEVLSAIDKLTNSGMIADHATGNIGDNEAMMVKVRLGVMDTITYVWECDCSGNWKEPPRIIRRRYIESTWTVKPGQ